MNSIRSFLLVSLLFAVTIATLSTALWTYNSVTKEINELFDGQLVDAGHILRRLVTHQTSRNCLTKLQEYIGPTDYSRDIPITAIIDESYPIDAHKYAVKRAFQIWHNDGTLLLKSVSAPDYHLAKIDGFSNRSIKNENWRVYSLSVPEYNLKFHVAQQENLRHRMMQTVAFTEILPLVTIYILLAIFVWYIVKFGLEQINFVTKAVNAKNIPQDLDEVALDNIPIELKPLIHELNNLFLSLKSAFAREQNFAADAAHELRTPMAIVKTQAQVALRAVDEATLDKALRNIIKGVNRCSHVVAQLSILNNLNPNAQINDPQEINLNTVLAEVVDELQATAIAKNSHISFEKCKNINLFTGNLVSMYILCRNLLDNAIRYSPEFSICKVIVKSSKACVKLIIEDSGPGIPEELKERVFERFYRRLGTKTSGSGLGLAIVSQVVILHKAAIELINLPDGRGLRITVTFPV